MILFDAVVERVTHSDAVRLTANYLTTDVMQYMEEGDEALFDRVTADAVADIIQMLAVDGDLSSRGAKDIIAVLAQERRFAARYR